MNDGGSVANEIHDRIPLTLQRTPLEGNKTQLNVTLNPTSINGS